MGGPDLDFDPAAFIQSSWGLHDVNQTVSGVVAALVNELGEQAGMAGDDDAGTSFARLYNSAADGAIDGIAHAANLIGAGSQTSFQAAITFMAKDAELAGRLRDQGLIGSGGSPGEQQVPECEPSPLGQAAGLPNVRGHTSTVDRWVWGDLFRGDPDKLRTVADTWRKTQRITARALDRIQECWALVRPARGQTAAATNRFFTQLCGYEPCLFRVDDGAALLANLPAACGQIARACDNYADHITTAQRLAPQKTAEDLLSSSPLAMLLNSPMAGGNGEDGGLRAALEGDAEITALSGIAHALDASRARVPIPRPRGVAPGIPFLPGIPLIPGGEPVPGVAPAPEIPLAPVGVLAMAVPAAYRPVNPGVAYAPPIAPPNPPEPGFPALTAEERKTFDSWASTLKEGDFGGPRNPNAPVNLYQYRVSGYPEKIIPISDGDGPGSRIGADGLRDTDGMVVEAKYVKNPNQCKTPRSLDSYMNSEKPWDAGTHKSDEVELEKYKAAMVYPGNHGQLRGVEVCTNDQDSVDYWDALITARQVRGYARYVP